MHNRDKKSPFTDSTGKEYKHGDYFMRNGMKVGIVYNRPTKEWVIFDETQGYTHDLTQDMMGKYTIYGRE